MSELKHQLMLNKEMSWVPCYPKSEADKVIAAKDKEIAELKEEQRWRKFPDEKPSEEGNYIICGSSGFRSCDKWTYCQDRKRMDFSFYTHGIEYWMPMPPAPKENDK